MSGPAVARRRRTWGDPEVGLDVVSLGLVYGIDTDGEGGVRIRMTTSTPVCPLEGYLAEAARRRVEALSGVNRRPAWRPEMMDAEVRRGLGWR